MASRHPFVTDKKRRVLRFWYDFTKSHGRPPTIREAMEGLDLSSTNAVMTHVHPLEAKGLMERERKGLFCCWTLSGLKVYADFQDGQKGQQLREILEGGGQ
jgi:SOS-response transcriptional repressor LexA